MVVIKCKICDKEFNRTQLRKYCCSDECKKKALLTTKKKWFDNNLLKRFEDYNIENLIGEEWKEVIDYPDYKISNKGRLLSRKNGLMLSNLNETGYYTYSLCKNGKHKTMFLHRILAIHFINNPNPEKYKLIDHIDRNRTNNSLDNLRWADDKINANNSISVLTAKHKSIYLSHEKNKQSGKIYEYYTVQYKKNNKKLKKRFKTQNDAQVFYDNYL